VKITPTSNFMMPPPKILDSSQEEISYHFEYREREYIDVVK
jgi:hypothetical protein